jgi:hypothetical protein
MVEEMQEICPSNGQGVSNVNSGLILDSQLPGSSMCQAGGFEADPDHYLEVNNLITWKDRSWLPPVLTQRPE